MTGSLSHAASIKCTYRLWLLVLTDGSNQITEVGWDALWVHLMWPQFEEECMQYSSASSIQAWNSTKQNVCFGIFMFTEKQVQIMHHLISFPQKIISFAVNSFPTLKTRNPPHKYPFSQWHENTSFPFLESKCTSSFCLHWGRLITTLAYQQKPVLRTVYKTACGLALVWTHSYLDLYPHIPKEHTKLNRILFKKGKSVSIKV